MNELVTSGIIDESGLELGLLGQYRWPGVYNANQMRFPFDQRGPQDPELPLFDGERGTVGILRTNDPEFTPIVLESGVGPAARAAGGPGSGYDAYTRYHVEGHAAQVMRELGITEAHLEVNNPCGVCPNCNNNLPSMLESESILTVTTPFAQTPRLGWQINPPPDVGRLR